MHLTASLRSFSGRHMSIIDTQRIAAVRKLEELGYTFAGGDWVASAMEGDALHALLVNRADALASSVEGSEENVELKAITSAIGAYEAVRWPQGHREGSIEGGWNCGQLILSP